jgi:hypothetical protein
LRFNARLAPPDGLAMTIEPPTIPNCTTRESGC